MTTQTEKPRALALLEEMHAMRERGDTVGAWTLKRVLTMLPNDEVWAAVEAFHELNKP